MLSLKTSRKSKVKYSVMLISRVSNLCKISSYDCSKLDSCSSSSITLKTSFTLFTFIAFRALNSRNTLNTLDSLKTSRSLIALVALLAFFALRTYFTAITFFTFNTLRTLRTYISTISFFTLDTLESSFTLRTNRTLITFVSLRKYNIEYGIVLIARVLYRSSFTTLYSTDLNCSSNTLLTLRTLLTCITLVTFRSNKNSCSLGFYCDHTISNCCNVVQKSTRHEYIITSNNASRKNRCLSDSILFRNYTGHMEHCSFITFVSLFTLDTLITFVSLRKYNIEYSCRLRSRICN